MSKTINMRHDEPPESVETAYRLAWRLRIKGTTVYRDKSKSRQVIYFGVKKTGQEKARRQEEPRPALIIEPRKEEKEQAKTGKPSLRLGPGKIKNLVTLEEGQTGACENCDL